MNMLVFGATGRVGQSILEKALANGHAATAFVRNRAKITTTSENLKVVEGDIYSAEAVASSMQGGYDAVINVIGGDVFKPSTLVTDSARTIIGAMEKTGLRRYLGITGGAQMRTTGLGGLTNTILGLSPIKSAVRDHQGAWQIVNASTLDWTLAGCPYIRDSAQGKAYKVSLNKFPGGFRIIYPQDVADFLVRELAEQKYPRQIVGIWH